MSELDTLRSELRSVASDADAIFLQRYFKTGPGEYAEGDRFLGVRVPQIRAIVRRHKTVAMPDIATLLASQYHEERLLALLLMVAYYHNGDEPTRERIFRLYLENTAAINNWDLVDSSAEIVGAHLENSDRSLLERLARSELIWERRIAILATFWYIKRGSFDTTLSIAEMLVGDRHDLIHKAVGWMLREVGQRDREAEERFLRKHAGTMPRTMLRYAIEKFPDDLRQRYLNNRFPCDGMAVGPRTS